jgi:hypothetical protein
MSRRRMLSVEFPFHDDDYRSAVIVVDGVVEESHDVEVRDEDGKWKPVNHPSPELLAAIVEAAHEYMNAAGKATSGDQWPV